MCKRCGREGICTSDEMYVYNIHYVQYKTKNWNMSTEEFHHILRISSAAISYIKLHKSNPLSSLIISRQVSSKFSVFQVKLFNAHY